MVIRPTLPLLLSALSTLASTALASDTHASAPETTGADAQAAFVFSQARSFHQERAAVANADGLWGYIDTHGRAITAFEYERADDFSEGLARVTRKGLSGYIDRSGQFVIAPQYNRGGSGFHAGLAKVHHYDSASNTWTHACINTRGHIVVSSKLDGHICHYHEGWAVTGKAGLYGFINREGRMLRIHSTSIAQAAGIDKDKHAATEAANRPNSKPMQTLSAEDAAYYVFHKAQPFREGLAAVALGKHLTNNWAYLDTRGHIAFALPANKVHDFHEGLAAIQRSDGRFAFVDRQGKAQTGFDFLDVLDFREGLAAVRTHTGWGYIDTRGQWVIEPRYAAASAFNNDRARVCSEHPRSSFIICNYINRQGQTAIPIQGYSAAQDFSHGLAAVLHHRLGLWGYIDTLGRPLPIAENGE